MSLGKIITTIALTTLCSVAHAGMFSTRTYGDGVENVGDKISDLVTDRFTQVFDANTYSVVVIFQHAQVGQDNVCMAIAGVTRRQSPDKQTLPIPAWRLTSTHLQRNSGTLDYARKEACLLSAIRSAVQDLMQVEPEAVRANSARSLANPAK